MCRCSNASSYFHSSSWRTETANPVEKGILNQDKDYDHHHRRRRNSPHYSRREASDPGVLGVQNGGKTRAGVARGVLDIALEAGGVSDDDEPDD